MLGGDDFGGEAAGVDGRERGTLIMVAGLAVRVAGGNILRRFCLSSVVSTDGSETSSCSNFLFFGLSIPGALVVVGSMGLGIESRRY